MRTAAIFIFFLATLAAAVASAGVLLQDDFDDNSLDPTKWWVNTSGFSKPPTSLKEQNQRIELQGRAHLNTVQQFDPATYPNGILVTGKWQFDPGEDDDMFQVLTRSDGQPTSPWGETANGVEFYLQQWSPGVFTIHSRGSAFVTNTVQHFDTLQISPGDTFSFSIYDDGANLSFEMSEVGDPTSWAYATATCTTDMPTDYVVFHNRESGRRSNLDDVVIQAPAAPPAPPLTHDFLNVGPQGGMGVFGIREVRYNGTISSIGDAVNSLLSGAGVIYDGYSPVVNFKDPQAAGGGGYFGNATKSPFLSDTASDDNDIALVASAWLAVDNPGIYTFGFRSDDGAYLHIEGANFTKKWGSGQAFGDVVAFVGPTGDSDTAASTYLGPGVHQLEFFFFEQGGGAYVELWAAPGDWDHFDPNAFVLLGDEVEGLRLVPEPATLALFGVAAGLALRRRRRR